MTQILCVQTDLGDGPLVVSYGGGDNSTAMLVGMRERDIVPDAILFADTGGEKEETYLYLREILPPWLKRSGFPEIVVVSNAGQYSSLYDECWQNEAMPSKAYGLAGCSYKWKRQVMDRWLRDWQPAKDCWERGGRLRRAIGIHAGEAHRKGFEDDKRNACLRPLVEWGWDFDDCLEALERAGLPRPGKSACYFCPALPKREVISLHVTHPDLFESAVRMERRALASGKWTIKGLGRHWSWEALVKAEAAQTRLWPELDVPCMCFDGDEG